MDKFTFISAVGLLFFCRTLTAQTVVVSNTATTPKDPTATLELQKPLNSKLNIRSGNYIDTAWLQFSNRTNANEGTDFNIIAQRETGLFFNTRSDVPGYVNDSLFTMLRSGSIGIGTRSPTSKLDVVGPLRLRDGTQGAGKILQSDANGYASWQAKTFGFSATGTLPAISNTQSISNNVVTTVTLINNEAYDQNGIYNLATGTVTIEESGVYHVDAQIQYTNAGNGNYHFHLYVNANAMRIASANIKAGGLDNQLPLSISTDIYLNAGEQVQLRTQQVSGMTQILLGGRYSFFSMHKLY